MAGLEWSALLLQVRQDFPGEEERWIGAHQGTRWGWGWVCEAGSQPALRVVSFSKMAGFTATVEWVMFVFLWGAHLQGSVLHYSCVANAESFTHRWPKQGGPEGHSLLGEVHDPCSRKLRRKGFCLPCTTPSIRVVCGYSTFLNPCFMKCHRTLVGRKGWLRSQKETEAEADKLVTLTANEKSLRAEAGCVSEDQSCCKVFLICVTNLRNISYNCILGQWGRLRQHSPIQRKEDKQATWGWFVCIHVAIPACQTVRKG